MTLSLKETVKGMQIEEAVDLLAEICQELIKRCELKRGPQGERGASVVGEQGPIGPPGRDADVAEVVGAAQRVMQDELQSAKDTLREIVVKELKQGGVIDSEGRAILIPGPPGKDGRDGVDGKDSTVPGPKGDVGPAGYTPKKGIDYFDGVPGQDGQSVVGLQGPVGRDSTVPGPQGTCGEPGQAGVTLGEVETLIREIIGTSGNDILQKFVALKKEISLIEKDRRYQRVDSVREEVVGRLQQHLE